MRIFLCCPTPVTKALGSSKVYVEVHEALLRAGAESRLVGPDEIQPGVDFGIMDEPEKLASYPQALRNFLSGEAGAFDVVEYEHTVFPFLREDLVGTGLEGKLRVARSVLLSHHLKYFRFPIFRTPRRMLGELVNGPARRKFLHAKWDMAMKTCHGADLINVPNSDDRDRLVKEGIPKDKVAVIPYGLTEERLAFLESSKNIQKEYSIATFIGTFDERKGAVEFPKIAEQMMAKVPNLRVRLLGTKGLFKTADAVLEKFPARLRPHLEVFPTFEPEKLNQYLEGTTVGIFPSHLESFGFGVLEMMAAGIPVAAYDVPGPPVMLRKDMLAHKGDWKNLSHTLINWLNNPGQCSEAGNWCRIRARDFRWDQLAEQTIETYQSAMSRNQP